MDSQGSVHAGTVDASEYSVGDRCPGWVLLRTIEAGFVRALRFNGFHDCFDLLHGWLFGVGHFLSFVISFICDLPGSRIECEACFFCED